ncbi:type II secretion system F family protein [Ramlibacter tataouinensis]|nr:type II secretion system F family protein [Ramlibacter tataouinensis]
MKSTYTMVLMNAEGLLEQASGDFASRHEAYEFAARTGRSVLRCEEEGARSRYSPGKIRGLLPGAPAASLDTISFTHDLAVLVHAGVTVQAALRALTQREKSGAVRGHLLELARHVDSGLSLSEAMRRSSGASQLLVATIAASEQTGDLATGLLRYARHQESLRAVRERVVGACVYPLLLLCVGSLVVALLLGIVVPRFATLVEINNRELPYLSYLLMAWGRWAGAHPFVGGAVILAAVISVVAALFRMRDPAVRRRWLQRVPGFAKLAREFQHLQMYRTAAILTSRGITVHQALAYCLELLNPADGQRLRAAITAMREGVAISPALANAGLSDVIASSMLSVAEQTGSLPEMLDRIADFYEQSLRRSIDLVSRLIEPVMMILFGIIIGGIVILMYLPIFDLASSIS